MPNYSRIETQISRQKGRLARMEQKFGLGYRPRKAWRPNMAAVRGLTRDIETLRRQHPRFLSVDEARVVLKAIERLYKRQRRLEDLVARSLNRLRDIEYRTRLTTKVICLRDLEAVAKWWLERRGAAGKDLHASALAKRSATKRRLKDPDCFKQLGKKGAEARWAKARAAQPTPSTSKP